VATHFNQKVIKGYSKISVSAVCPLEQGWRSKKGKTRPLPPEGLLANINLNVVFWLKQEPMKVHFQ
jgi:hypothetical protein